MERPGIPLVPVLDEICRRVNVCARGKERPHDEWVARHGRTRDLQRGLGCLVSRVDIGSRIKEQLYDSRELGTAYSVADFIVRSVWGDRVRCSDRDLKRSVVAGAGMHYFARGYVYFVHIGAVLEKELHDIGAPEGDRVDEW